MIEHLLQTSWASDAHSQLTSAGAFRLADEATLVSRQNAMLHSRSAHAHLGRVRRARNLERVRASAHMLAAIFDLEDVVACFLRFDA